MRGVMGGAIWGLVFALGGAVVLSLLYPVAPRPDVGDSAPQSAALSPDSPQSGVAPAGGDGDLVEVAPSAPGGVAVPDDLSPAQGADTTPGEKPQVGQAIAPLEGPSAATRTSDIAPAPGDAPGRGAPRATPGTVPAAPVAGDDPARISTQPAQPAAPQPRQSDAGPGQPVQPDMPEVAQDPVAEVGPGMAGRGPVTGRESRAIADESAATGDSLDKARSTAPVPDPGYQPRQPQFADLPQAGTGARTVSPTVGKRVLPLTERDGTAASRPTDGGAWDSDPSEPALTRHAAPFRAPEDQPLMAIVLIDDGGAVDARALADFPYPLTFAVDATAPDAAEKMARHRAAGFEVVAMFDLPDASAAQDAEVALAAGFDQLDRTVALLEGPGSGIQGNRVLSDQVSAFLNATGRGLITRDKGLNTVQKLALRNGVPAAVVFRDFDSGGQSPEAMRRFLDQAAFRAGQEGAVIMLGRLRADTISALLQWGLQDRAARVTLAPVSAVLQRSLAR